MTWLKSSFTITRSCGRCRTAPHRARSSILTTSGSVEGEIGPSPQVFEKILTVFSLVLAGLFLAACSTSASIATTEPVAKGAELATSEWDWFSVELTDAQTGQTFTMNDYAGKVVLVETMAIWCPTCIGQAKEVRDLHQLLGNPDDLISVSLDVDLHEDKASLKEYAGGFGFDWHFAVAPIEVARALGNLYSAEYLNPPLSPMLIIDRNGEVHTLEYGKKSAETLQKSVEPYLTQ